MSGCLSLLVAMCFDFTVKDCFMCCSMVVYAGYMESNLRDSPVLLVHHGSFLHVLLFSPYLKFAWYHHSALSSSNLDVQSIDNLVLYLSRRAENSFWHVIKLRVYQHTRNISGNLKLFLVESMLVNCDITSRKTVKLNFGKVLVKAVILSSSRWYIHILCTFLFPCDY